MSDVKFWKDGSGMTRVTPDSNYPHVTEQWRKLPDGTFEKLRFDDNPMLDAHYSPSKTGEREGRHLNRAAILDDLGIDPPK